MNSKIFWTIFISSLFSFVPQISGNSESPKEICDFVNTVDLRGRKMYVDGTYGYDEILIPPEQQAYFDYELKFQGEKVKVPKHLRGCACKRRPCAKLCCQRDQFFSETTKHCEMITPDMKVSWEVDVNSNMKFVKNVNISQKFTLQIGLPCNEPIIFDSKRDKYMLEENGELSVEAEEGDQLTLNSLSYCYSPQLNTSTNTYKLMPYSCYRRVENDWKFDLNAWSMAISVIFLIATILVYLAFQELRGYLECKILICYLISLTVGYAILSFINISEIVFSRIPCSILGFTCYFFFMSAFLWLGVLCHNISVNLKASRVEHYKLNPFIMYSLYVWISAAIATLALIIIQNFININEIYKPDIGIEWCWLNTNKWSAVIYFYGPNSIILLFNVITFIRLITRIYRGRRNLAEMNLKSMVKVDVMVILRLFLIMGITWIFDILSYFLRGYPEWQIVFIASDVLNALQGLFIFVLFVLKDDVLTLIKYKFKTKSEPAIKTFTNMQNMETSDQSTNS